MKRSFCRWQNDLFNKDILMIFYWFIRNHGGDNKYENCYNNGQYGTGFKFVGSADHRADDVG